LWRLKDLPPEGIFPVKHHLLRIDQISFEIYGSTRYWWILLFYNDLIDPWDVPTGTDIRYPPTSGIEQLYFDLQAKMTLRGRLR